MRYSDLTTSRPAPIVQKKEETFGDGDQIGRQIYRITGVAGLDASLKVLVYPESPGRIVQGIEVWPEEFQGKGYAQALYLAALRDGPINERPQFRSSEAGRAVERLVAKGLVTRREDALGAVLALA